MGRCGGGDRRRGIRGVRRSGLRRRDGPATRACKVKGGTRSTSADRSRVLAAMLGSALGIALTPLLSYRWATCLGAYLHYGRAYFLVYTGCSMGLAGL